MPSIARGSSRVLPLVMVVAVAACTSEEGDDATGGRGNIASDDPGRIRVDVVETERVVWSTRHGACPSVHPLDVDLPDGPVRVFRDTTGSLQLISPHHPTFRQIGPSLDHMPRICQPALASHYNPSYDSHDNLEWLWATYRAPEGTVYGLVHNEWYPGLESANPPWRNTVTLVRSDDAGASYHHAPAPTHVIAQSPYPPDDGPDAAGYFEPALIRSPLDGMFYALVRVSPHREQAGGTCLLRTANIADPGSWRAWDGAGFHADVPRGALCTPVIDSTAHAVGSVVFSTRFERFMASMMFSHGGRQGLAIRLSRDLIHWGEPLILVEGRMPWDPPPPPGITVYAYPSIIDPASPDDNFTVAGDEVYLYYVFWTESALDRRLARIKIRFEELPPERNSIPGLFNVGGAVYASNGRARCVFTSPAHFEAQAGAGSWENVATWESVPGYLADHGPCAGSPGSAPPTAPPDDYVGFFRVGGGGHYANGLHHYCHLEGWDQFVGCTAGLGVASQVWGALPSFGSTGSLQHDGRCGCGRGAISPPPDFEGFFRIGGGGHYANGLGDYCHLGSWAQYTGCTTAAWSSLPLFENAGDLEHHGLCLCGR